MAGYNQKIKIQAQYQQEAKNFLLFLQKIGRKYARPVKIHYRYLGRGYFYIEVNGGPGGIDALFQELIINRGLYYYACTLVENKKQIISSVILPLFSQLIDYRFNNSQSRFLRKHILGKHAQTDFIPSDIKNSHGYSFEILYRRWDLKLITNKDYIIELDALLHFFLLDKLDHTQGSKSPIFSNLVDQLKDRLIFDPYVVNSFNEVHTMRTGILHRLENPKTTEELINISNTLYNHFQYLDEYYNSQKEKTIILRGKRYKRVKYGDESILDEKGNPYLDNNGKPYDWIKLTSEKPCHDCGVKRGFYHVEGCDAEICPRCGGQYISFDCGIPK
jgi:hypothetical protein